MADPVTVHRPGVAFALNPAGDRVTVIGPNGNLVTVALASRRITRRFDEQASGIAYDGRSRLVATDSRGGMRVAGRALAVAPAWAVGSKLAVAGRIAVTSGTLSLAVSEASDDISRDSRPRANHPLTVTQITTSVEIRRLFPSTRSRGRSCAICPRRLHSPP